MKQIGNKYTRNNFFIVTRRKKQFKFTKSELPQKFWKYFTDKLANLQMRVYKLTILISSVTYKSVI